VAFFVLAVALGERTIGQKPWEGWVRNAGYILLFVMVFQFCIVSNIIGFNMQERYEKTYAISLRMVSLLESQPDFDYSQPVAILGGYPAQSVFPSTDITKEDLIGYFGVDGDYSANSAMKYAEFMKHYLGVTIITIPEPEQIALTETQEYSEMSYFPNKGCLRKIGDVWVIKLNG
jgi:hypothetical protein